MIEHERAERQASGRNLLTVIDTSHPADHSHAVSAAVWVFGVVAG
jgi:hypothetical protein